MLVLQRCFKCSHGKSYYFSLLNALRQFLLLKSFVGYAWEVSRVYCCYRLVCEMWYILCIDWKTHATEYYECSKYKADPKIAEKTAGAKARAALEKYLFYYNRVRKCINVSNLGIFIYNTVGKP